MATRSDDRAEFNSQIPLDGNRHEAQATGATVIAGALLGVSLLALIKRKKKDEKDKTQKDADDKQDVGNEGDDAAPNPTVDGAGQNAGDGANNAGKGVKGGPCGCFIAGTDVLTPSGLVDIETIDIGDLVMAWREDGTGYGSYPVSALIRPPSRVIRQLTLLDAQGNIETFETTDDHPWHVSEGPVNEGHDGAVGNQGNFLRTDELAAGMEISTQDGDGVSVIEVIKTTERAPTYNLTVADAHTFFVGNDGIWVHNTDCFDSVNFNPNRLPRDVRDATNNTLADINSGRQPEWLDRNGRKRWGSEFKNKDGDLPRVDASGKDITYEEYRIRNTRPNETGAGVDRIVVGSDGRRYYSGTHYGDNPGRAFVRIK